MPLLAPYNETGVIGSIINEGTTGVTGNIILTFLLIIIFLFAICLMFQISMDLIGVVLIPIILTLSSFYGGIFLGIMVCIFIIIAWGTARNWLAR